MAFFVVVVKVKLELDKRVEGSCVGLFEELVVE